jgi:hypothetical protein
MVIQIIIIPNLIIKVLFLGYQDDEEIVLQTIFVYICMLSYEGEFAKRLCSYQYVINENETEENAAHTPSLIELLLNFMYHKNPRLRSLCNKALKLLSVNLYANNYKILPITSF